MILLKDKHCITKLKSEHFCIFFLKIQETQEFANQTSRIENLNLELTKQTLNTMLGGLTKIKDQLNSVATQ